MTIRDFHTTFKLFLDKVDSSAYSEFEPIEIDYILNEAQDRIVKQRYSGNNIYKTGFEQSQKRTDDLKNITLTKYCKVVPVTSLDFYGDKIYQAKLDKLYNDKTALDESDVEYMFYLRSRVEINKGCTGWRQVNLIKQDDLETIYVDPFNRPSSSNPIIYFEDNSVFIVCGDGSAESLMITFIKRPNRLNIGTYGMPKIECELSEHLHEEIVQVAVGIALENIESNRVQTHTPINENKIE